MRKLENFFTILNRVIVDPDPAEAKTRGGIIIPDTMKEKPKRGAVVALGSGASENNIAIGDRVQYGKYAGTEIFVSGFVEPFEVVSISEILIVEKGEKTKKNAII